MGLLSGIPIIGDVIDTSVGLFTNESNKDFNREEANKNRAFNKEEADTSRTFNSEQAEIARNFSERMSATELQRKKQDWEAAGLSLPAMLAGGGSMSGASVGASPTASSSPASGSPASYHGGLQSSMQSAMSKGVEFQLIRAQARDVNSAADLKVIDGQTRAALNVAALDEKIASIDKIIADTKLTDESRRNRIEERKNLIQMRLQIIATTAKLGSDKALTDSHERRSRMAEAGDANVERINKSKAGYAKDWVKNLNPFRGQWLPKNPFK